MVTGSSAGRKGRLLLRACQSGATQRTRGWLQAGAQHAMIDLRALALPPAASGHAGEAEAEQRHRGRTNLQNSTEWPCGLASTFWQSA